MNELLILLVTLLAMFLVLAIGTAVSIVINKVADKWEKR